MNCDKPFSMRVNPSGPSCPTVQSAITIPHSDTDGITETKTASVQRFSIIGGGGSFLNVINTGTNTVIATTATDIEVTVDGSVGCFATSVNRFYFPSTSGGATKFNVYDSNGAFLFNVSLPANSFNSANFIYSPEQDMVYVGVFNSITSTTHIIAINPHTNAIVGDVDTNAGGVRLGYTPNRIIVISASDGMVSYTLPAITQEHTLVININGEMAYSTITDKIFIGIQTFSTPVSFVEIDPATLMVTKTYVTSTTTELLVFATFNPVANAVVFLSFGGQAAVVDPVKQTIVCEFTVPTSSGSGAGADYSSGDVYLYDTGSANNQLSRYD